jgi:hypothetical protein
VRREVVPDRKLASLCRLSATRRCASATGIAGRLSASIYSRSLAVSADCSAAGPLTSDVGDHHAAIHLFRCRSIAGWPLRVRRARRPRTDAPSRQGARQRSDIGRGLRGSGHLFGGTCRRRAPASGDIAVHPWLDVGWAPHSKGEVRRPPLNLSGPCLSWVNASSRARPIRPHCTPSSAEASLARSRASTLTRDPRGAHK